MIADESDLSESGRHMFDLSQLWNVYGWLQEHFGTLVTALFFLFAGAGVVWWHWDHIKKLPGVGSTLNWFIRRPIPLAPGGLTIAVAHLRDDREQRQEKLLLDELGQFEGADIMQLDRAVSWPKRDTLNATKAEAEEDAQQLLNQTRADLLLWGSVIEGEESSAIRLYWTAAQDLSGAKRMEKYLIESIELPEMFWDDLKRVVSLLVQDRLAKTLKLPEQYIVGGLAPMITQVRSLLVSKQGHWGADTRAGVEYALASAEQTAGVLSGSADLLEAAISRYHSILRDWTRQTAPMRWAVTQNNLGSALATG